MKKTMPPLNPLLQRGLIVSLFFLSPSAEGGWGEAVAQTSALIESGKVKQKAGNHSGAIADFSAAITQNEPEIKKFLKAKEQYEAISDSEKVKKDIAIPSIDSGYADLFFLRGTSHFAIAENSEALQDFGTAIKINPALAGAYYLRGKLLWSSGKKEEGCINFYKAASLKSKEGKEIFEDKFCWKDAEIAYKDASLKIRMKEYQDALALIEKALKVCPDSANYLAIRGRAYLGLEKLEPAIQDFDRALKADPDNLQANYGRGMANYHLGKYQEAFDDLTKAILKNGKLTNGYLYRAYCCEKLDKKRSALFDYEQVQRLSPNDANIFFKSGLLRKELGDEKGACRDFKKAAEIGHPEAEDYAALCK